MRQSNAFIVLRAFGDEENQESGTQNASITDTPEFQEALKSHLAQALEQATTGLKNKNFELIAETKKAKEQYNALIAQIEDEKDQADLKAGKIDVQAINDKKIAARDREWEARYNELLAAKEESDKAIAGERSKLKSFQIKQFVINEALKNEFFHATAADDLANLAAGVWDLTESGDLVARDKDGNIALGKNGRALTPKEWIEDQQKIRPHYFKTMAGSGAKPGVSGVQTMSRAEWNTKILDSTAAEEKELFKKWNSGQIVIQ
ncbi:hypothetical protein [Ectopseudomonas oleovorans]|uniref:hypothetical protein n=1 Tax=Ectopseudomonas oleovorans TaxID=301 RepID=UPI0035AEA314